LKKNNGQKPLETPKKKSKFSNFFSDTAEKNLMKMSSSSSSLPENSPLLNLSSSSYARSQRDIASKPPTLKSHSSYSIAYEEMNEKQLDKEIEQALFKLSSMKSRKMELIEECLWIESDRSALEEMIKE
jgi:hypothetical protein